MEFEWDENKRAINLLKQGLDFPDTPSVLAGPCIFEPTHAGTDEARMRAIGQLGRFYVLLVFTMRDDVVRVISLRRARDGERRKHQALHG